MGRRPHPKSHNIFCSLNSCHPTQRPLAVAFASSYICLDFGAAFLFLSLVPDRINGLPLRTHGLALVPALQTQDQVWIQVQKIHGSQPITMACVPPFQPLLSPLPPTPPKKKKPSTRVMVSVSRRKNRTVVTCYGISHLASSAGSR